MPVETSEWIVVYHHETVAEYESIRDRKARKAVRSIVPVLWQLGPKLGEPHSKKVAGARKLRELRPREGTALVRPLYAQVGPRSFVIFAIAPEAVVDRPGFDAAVRRARRRAAEGYGLAV